MSFEIVIPAVEPESRIIGADGIELDSCFRRNDIVGSMKIFCVYILASKRNGTLYIGVTSNLLQRVWQHKNDIVEGFTKKYKVHTLVYYEQTEDGKSALAREKQLKKWNRKWKMDLIEKQNPQWNDLYDDLMG